MFDQQTALAGQLGLADTPARRASEQLMQRYYRAARLVRQVNTILLQNLHARLFPISTEPVPIDGEFVGIDELLHVRDERLFERRPGAMLDAFALMQAHPRAQGHVGAHAARAVAQPPSHRRGVPARPAEPRRVPPPVPEPPRASCTSCGG